METAGGHFLFKATKHLLLTSAVSLVLLPGYTKLTQAQTHSSISSASQRSGEPQLISLNKSGATSLSNVRTVYVAPFAPDSGGFRSNFIGGLRSWGRFQLVSSRSQADAVIQGSAGSTGYGFRGQVAVVSTRDNRVLWSGTAVRRDGTRDGMAFNQLISRLKAASR